MSVEQSVEERITQAEARLEKLKDMRVDAEMLKPLQDQLTELKREITLRNLETKLEKLKSEVSPPTISFEEALILAREADAKAARREKEGQTREQEDATKNKAIDRASAAAVGEDFEKEVAAKAERARVPGERQPAYMAIDKALRGMDYGQRAATEAELRELSAAIEYARRVGVLEKDLLFAQQLRQQALDAATALVERQQSAAEAEKMRRRMGREDTERAATKPQSPFPWEWGAWGNSDRNNERKATERAEAQRRREQEGAERAKEAQKQQEKAVAERAAKAAAETAEREAKAAAEAAERAAKAVVEAAERAAAEKAAAEAAERAEAERLIRRSISLPGPQRKAVLRELQLQWHPDQQVGKDQGTIALAEELSYKINEAMTVAKKNAKLRGEKF